MIRLIGLIGLIGIMGLMSINQTFAFDRSTSRQGVRVISNSNFTYNVNTVVINVALNAGPTTVGSNDRSLPAYQQIAQITAQIQALKLQLKNFSPQ